MSEYLPKLLFLKNRTAVLLVKKKTWYINVRIKNHIERIVTNALFTPFLTGVTNCNQIGLYAYECCSVYFSRMPSLEFPFG